LGAAVEFGFFCTSLAADLLGVFPDKDAGSGNAENVFSSGTVSIALAVGVVVEVLVLLAETGIAAPSASFIAVSVISWSEEVVTSVLP
jgi:hypothetical protein